MVLFQCFFFVIDVEHLRREAVVASSRLTYKLMDTLNTGQVIKHCLACSVIAYHYCNTLNDLNFYAHIAGCLACEVVGPTLLLGDVMDSQFIGLCLSPGCVLVLFSQAKHSTFSVPLLYQENCWVILSETKIGYCSVVYFSCFRGSFLTRIKLI